MKKYIFTSLIAASLLSCNYMDEFPYDWQEPVDVFSMEQNYERPINQAYSYLPEGFNRVSSSFLDAATDDGSSTIRNSDVHRIARAYTTSNSPGISSWAPSYRGIRQALFVQKSLAEIDLVLNNKSQNDVKTIKNTYTGEMYALRAWYEFDLLRHYGGYPIVSRFYELGDPELAQIERSPVADCIQNIVNLCDSAAKYLDVTTIGGNAGYGRMTRGAALAIKAKTLVYSASPLFNQQGNANPLIGYVSPSEADIKTRWEAAAEACAQVINLKLANGNAVYTFNASYANTFTTSPASEFIVFRTAPKSSGLENRQYPPSLSNSAGGGTVPTQEFVDAFTLANGTDYVRDPQTNPYTNRDPRFAATVGFDGSKYGNLPVIYTRLGQGSTIDGLNVTADRSTNTGYYLRKFLDLNIDFTKASAGTAFHIFPLIRLADIYLLYSEAMNEAYGPGVDPKGYGLTAKTALQRIRTRAGFNASDRFLEGVEQVTAMRSKIKQERRIELSFEEQRYFDLRRWMDGDQLNKPITGVRIEVQGGITTNTYFPVDAARKFETRMYLHPIPLSETMISPRIVQNPGW